MLDTLWILTCTSLVFVMQAGFLCLESGLTRSKNSIDVAIKNVADFSLSLLIFWCWGFGVMFGASWFGFTGVPQWGIALDHVNSTLAAPFLFQAMFCATAATIVSGAVAERMTFHGYLLVTLVVTGLIYPLVGHWAWGGTIDGHPTGWLARMGFVDFAGSTVVHGVGAWAALAAVIVIGPRQGVFEHRNGGVSGSNLPFAILGVLLLWFGWIGFNGGSTQGFNDEVVFIIGKTFLAGSAGMLTCLLVGLLVTGQTRIRDIINGTLAGLVAITACCHAVSGTSAIIIGCVGAVIAHYVSRLLRHVHVDDAVDAIPIHGAAGVWGTLAVALFGDLDVLHTGLTRLEQLQVQWLGVLVACGVTFLLAYAALSVTSRYLRLRVTPEHESIGLNVAEHGASTETHQLLATMKAHADDPTINDRAYVDPFSEVGPIALHYNKVLDALEHANAELRLRATAVDAAYDMIVVTDVQGNITYVNPAFVGGTGYSAAEVIGRPTSILNSGTHDRAFFRNLWRTILNGKVWKGEIINRRRDGATYPEQQTITPIRNTSGEISQFVAIKRDVTEEKRIEDIERERRALEESVESMQQVLGIAGHELRTPIAALRATAEFLLMLKDRSTEEAERFLGSIRDETERMARLVNNVLEAARVDSGAARWNWSDVVLKEVVDQAVNTAQGAMKPGTATLTADLPQEDIHMRGDNDALRRLLINLLTNAAKATTEGHVAVTVREYLVEDNPFVEIAVSDTGTGMPPEVLERLGQAFALNSGLIGTKHVAGAGLGLAISRGIVAAHGGTITVQSTEGEGTSFTIRLRSDLDGPAEGNIQIETATEVPR